MEEMPKEVVAVGTKRKRKPNFSMKELSLISDTVEANKETLHSKLTNNLTNKMKNKVWAAIADKVNALGVAERSVQDIKDKWKGLVSAAKKEHSQEKKSKRQTGGGPPCKEPSKISKMLVEVYQDTPGFSGLEDGFETEMPSMICDPVQVIDGPSTEDADPTFEAPTVEDSIIDDDRAGPTIHTNSYEIVAQTKSKYKKNQRLKYTPQDLLSLQCEGLQMQKEVFGLKMRKLQIEVMLLESSLDKEQ